MKIKCISYFHPFINNGGGEMITKALIEEGRRRGVNIEIESIRPRIVEGSEEADMYWLVDIFNFPHSLKSRGAWESFKESMLERIIARRPFIHMSNAYADVCNLPYLPCSGKKQVECPHKSRGKLLRNITIKDFGKTCFSDRDLPLRLFVESDLNIFLSPLHRKIIGGLVGEDKMPDSYILKPIIDCKSFYNQGVERDIKYLFVGVIGEAKGLDEMRQTYSSEDMHFVGKISKGEELDFGTYHGCLPYEQIPDMMNRAQHFVFLPRWPEPQGRVVVEAALCGCKLITNQNVGATSFDFDISNPNQLLGAKAEFWDMIEKRYCNDSRRY